MLVDGNIDPHFVVTTTSEQNIRKQQAVITSSKGSVLREINGLSTRDFLSSIGLLHGSGLEALSAVPFVVNYNDGSQPVARAIYSLNDDGSAVCGGVMPEGGTLSIGFMDVADVLLTAEQSIKTLLQHKDISCILMFPCLGRNMVLGFNTMEEIDIARNILGDSLPWHLAYSGGEVCPVYNKAGGTVNRFHNFAFTACAI
ncbi:MAG: FIST C-terminal domain-containing protein [Syntrophorhabdaceae bacterium]|nr:FIST C-terminal domain-containing protein [Syntrophorhabdaceae bacterium]